MSDQTPAGWYPDPDDPGKQRYWDGEQWTEHRADAVAQPPAVTQPAVQPPPAAHPGQPIQPSKSNNRPVLIGCGILALVVLLGFVACGALVSSSDSGSSSGTATQAPADDVPASAPPAGEAKFKGKVTVVKVVNPATVRFLARVENVGDAAGVPDCTVTIEDPSGTYRGFDFFDLEDPLKPGEARGFQGILTITNEGAIFATESDVECDVA